jgi:hypothetical protein
MRITRPKTCAAILTLASSACSGGRPTFHDGGPRESASTSTGGLGTGDGGLSGVDAEATSVLTSNVNTATAYTDDSADTAHATSNDTDGDDGKDDGQSTTEEGTGVDTGPLDTDTTTSASTQSTTGGTDASDDESESPNSSDGSDAIDPCEPNPCEHGSCEIRNAAYFCDCEDGYEGDECEVNIDDCDPDPCEHGTCVDGVASYACDCGSTSYTGEFCETEIQTCAETPCENGGACTDEGNSRTCDCTDTGYEGASCTTDIDECDDDPCDPLTECSNEPGSFTCSGCPSGYTGTGETGCVNVDECDTDNGGCDALTVCTDNPGGRSCGTCPTGYSGNGEIGCTNIDDCNPNPCLNGGACSDEVDAFECSCVAPWTGPLCGSGTLTLEATHRGYYSSFSGILTDGITLAGSIGAEWSYHVYFVFRIPEFTGTVDSVTLRLENESYVSEDVSESFVVYDVSTDIDELVEFTGDQLEIFDDLGSGTQYGTFTLSPSTVNTIRPVLLTGALSDVFDARGSDFAVGVRCQSLEEGEEEYARFSGAEEARTHQLQIVVVP